MIWFAYYKNKSIPASTATPPADSKFMEISLNNDLMPTLSDKCFHHHEPDARKQESDYRLDTEEHAKKDSKEGSYCINHEQLTSKYQVRHFRLTDVHGHVFRRIFA